MIWLVGGLFLVGAVPIALLYRRERARARARVRGSQIADTEIGVVEFAVVGDGPALLVSHGTGGGFDQGLELVDEFARRGFRIVAPSRFGYLRSDAPAGASPAAQADAFAFLLRSLGIEQVVALGASAGAPAALQFAIRHPALCAAVVLLVPAALLPEPRRAPPPPRRAVLMLRWALLRSSLLYWLGLRLMPETMTRSVLGTAAGLVNAAVPEERQRVMNTLRRIMPIGARARGIALDQSSPAVLESFPLDRITAPLLAISCEDDLFGTCAVARYIASRVANSRLVVFPEGGHLFVGHSDDLWNEVGAFLCPIAGRG